MAKKSVSNRNNKRIKLASRMRAKRNKLRKDAIDLHLTEKERSEARIKLQKLPRDSSPTRRRNRCKLCGRPRAYNRLTGLCRLHMRIATIQGMVPGMHKASW
jgi:small subunit ribosomal protein S14